MAVARTAAQHGARILTHVSASQATGTSVRLTDGRTQESFDVTAGAVINAAAVRATATTRRASSTSCPS
ncbi:hypothetical protein [Mycobacterium sp. E1214]|uniref:hypothetical protein n=1 Tax=Mycobacterium sp. E1214 TaxID=1834123 RepID=UPI0035136A1D